MLAEQRPKQENEKSTGRKIAEHQGKKWGKKAGKQAKQAIKKFAKQALKKSAKVAMAVIKKVLLWLLGSIGLPSLLVIGGLLVLVIIVSLVSTFMFGTGEGLEGKDKKVYEYIVSQSNSTVNMDSALERPYRVPKELIASVIQIDVMEGKNIYEVIKNMATSLAPSFDYGVYDEWYEKQVIVCENGWKGRSCDVGNIEHTSSAVTKLNSVEFWNGSTVFNYKKHVTDWDVKKEISYRTDIERKQEKQSRDLWMKKVDLGTYLKNNSNLPITYYDPDNLPSMKAIGIYMPDYQYQDATSEYVPIKEVKMVTKEIEHKITIETQTNTRNQYFSSTSATTADYSTFDDILNSYGFGLQDKQLVEANYLFLDGQIAYTDWLKQFGGSSDGFSSVGFDGTVIPGAGVPPQFMPFYLSAEKKYGVHWYTLAAIHYVETGFSTHPTMISSVGAVGHLQFMPATWTGWSYNIGGGLVPASLDITSLDVIKKGGGYGVDGNGDGKADPWNVEDSIHTAANYLSKNGYSKDARKAIWAYNHADWYVNKVISNSEKFKNQATYQVAGGGDTPPLAPGSFMRPATGTVTSGFGGRWGAIHYGLDIGKNGRSGNVPIVASADGTVVKSYLSSSYGNCVIIRHNINGQQYETLYAHMQSRAVSTGTKVKQGQFIGYMGYTGSVVPAGPGGAHLHFEIHKGAWNFNKSGAINPALLVKGL